MSEHHFNWCSPDNSICVRPFGWNVQYDTGNTDFSFHGEMRFFRHQSNGGAMWGLWHENGFLDLSEAPNPTILFPNNFKALSWRNAAGTNSLMPLYVDDRNRTVLGVGGGGSDVYVQSNWMDVNNLYIGGEIAARSQPSTKIQMAGFYTWILSNNSAVAAFSKYQVTLYKPLITDSHVNAPNYRVNNKQVVGAQCAAIPDPNGTLADGTRALKATLACLRQHGLVAR